jgi:hypothetical protein
VHDRLMKNVLKLVMKSRRKGKCCAWKVEAVEIIKRSQQTQDYYWGHLPLLNWYVQTPGLSITVNMFP